MLCLCLGKKGSLADMLGCFSFFGIFWKCARIGERLSPYVSICCILMAVSYTLVLDLVSDVIADLPLVDFDLPW